MGCPAVTTGEMTGGGGGDAAGCGIGVTCWIGDACVDWFAMLRGAGTALGAALCGVDTVDADWFITAGPRLAIGGGGATVADGDGGATVGWGVIVVEVTEAGGLEAIALV